MGALERLHKVLRVPIGAHVVDGSRRVEIEVNLASSQSLHGAPFSVMIETVTS
jgi:hypothetical protein